MRNKLTPRFWIEAIGGGVTAVLFVVTMASREWIETVFGVEPDAGNGSLEWALVAAFGVLTIVLWMLAGRDWRRAAAAPG
jgi:hypothetical protein